jgi:microcystin-dependent protein
VSRFSRSLLIFCLSGGLGVALLSSPVIAAPLVVVPGDSASYLYFPAGDSPGPGSAEASSAEPIGFIGMFPLAPPEGWLECDGSTVQAADYPDLVLALTGNPAATAAALPDMRGMFVRGWDNGRGLDPGRALGSEQSDQNLAHTHAATAVSTEGFHTHALTLDPVPSHTHKFDGNQFVDKRYDSDHLDRTGSSYLTNRPRTTTNGAHSHSISNLSTGGGHAHAVTSSIDGGVEARPRNVAIIFAVKATE